MSHLANDHFYETADEAKVIIALPADPLSLTVLTEALLAYVNEINREQMTGDRNDAPMAAEYTAAMALLDNITIHEASSIQVPLNFGEFAPMICEVDGEDIVDRARAVVLPNFGYAHDRECAGQWEIMEAHQ